MPIQPALTSRFTDAVGIAHRVHWADVRKGTAIPYLAHLLSVSAIVLEHGGSEDQAIAALLHDAAEDHGGLNMIDLIRAECGDAVAEIVEACSDSFTDDPTKKPAWWPRKVEYLDHLADVSDAALLVSAADKLHNARSILADYRTDGDELWSRFNKDSGRMGSLWYYRRLEETYSTRLQGEEPLVRLVDELRRTVDAIYEHAAMLGHDVAAELALARGKEVETGANGQLTGP